MVASLDHTMWFAAGTPFRADEWMLFEMTSPLARGNRGLNMGRIFRRDGRLVVTCVQEALIRVRPRGGGGGAKAMPAVYDPHTATSAAAAATVSAAGVPTVAGGTSTSAAGQTVGVHGVTPTEGGGS